jgi:hypothetical protein
MFSVFEWQDRAKDLNFASVFRVPHQRKALPP